MIRLFLISILLTKTIFIFSQSTEPIWKFPDSNSNGKKITELIKEIEELNSISIAYSASQFIDIPVSQVPLNQSNLETFLSLIFTDYKIALKKASGHKYVLALKEFTINLVGNIYDSETAELIAGALVIDKSTNSVVFADDKGFYFLTTKPGNINLEVSMLGYDKYLVSLNQITSGKINFYLKQNNELPVVTKISSQLYDPLTEILPNYDHIGKKSVFGEYDPMSEVKILPGVISGIEGQTGLVIRGGSPDQNLIMLDGMPLYESSHIGNLSSLFINESIRSIDFMKSGMPARYGGRLNSMINIQLKEGNKNKRQTNINLGPQGGTFFTEGPILKGKLSYTLGLRNSWINTFITPFKSKISLFDDINIQYRDLITKICYKIDDDKKLTASFYTGIDRLVLLKDNPVFNDVSVSEKNQFDGKNTLLSINYDQTFTDKLKLNFQAGFINYRVFSRGTYDYIIDREDSISSHLDILNKSTINDKQLGLNLDYYVSDNLKIRSGVGYINHEYNPAVKQSISVTDNVLDSIDDPDSSYIADEVNGYFEINLSFWNRLKIIPGVYAINYSIDGYKSNSFQPRMQLLLDISKKINLHFAYSQTTQFIHLLSTNGLGLPNELWVPSTSTLPAEKLNHISGSLKFKPNEFHTIQVSGYIKEFENLIEYIEPVDLFFNILGDNETKPILNSQRDWNRKVDIGSGTSNGVEFSYNILKEKYQGWFSYHYGRAYRLFQAQNDGNRFLSRYDHPHNFNIGFNINVSPKWTLGAQWIYSSGQPFTIADIEITPPFDSIPVTQPTRKNNYRIPAFHTLNVSGEYTFKIKDIKSKLSLGVYNVYNRLNSFYIYSIKNPNNEIIFKKVSLYPILPQINFKFYW